VTPIVRSTLQMMAAIVGVVSGVAALTTEGDLLAALYAVGKVMTFVGLACCLGLGFWKLLRQPGWTAGFLLGLGIAGAWVAIGDPDLGISGDPDTFGYWQVIGLAFVVEALAIALGLAYAIHSRSLKRCPDCISTVPAAAKVCRYCGYRFG
jgi:hypothetical protein